MLIKELQKIVGERGVVSDPAALKTYESDGLVAHPHAPDVVVLPSTTQQVVDIVKLAAREHVSVIARGNGTGLSGGSTPSRGGIVISTARLNRVLEIDPRNNRARVQPGVINYEVSLALKPFGYHFAADPSSQKVSTIGGNIAHNSGGPHCVKYGVTGSHVLGVQVVLADGSVFWSGDGAPDSAGYDLTGVITGSEGTFCMVTEAWVKMTRLPEALRVALAFFPAMTDVAQTVSQLIAGGFLPAALEAMDANTLHAVDAAYHIGLPIGTQGALLVEVDGVSDGLDAMLDEIVSVCKANHAFEVRPAVTADEQAKLWAARKNALGAMGRIARNYYLVDTVVPRTRLPYMMTEVERVSREVNLPIANVFHAGDGNLHPNILFDRTKPGEYERAHAAAAEIMRISIAQGGTISGEHGIGIEKQEFMPLLFNRDDLSAMAVVHHCFDPDDVFNPGKVFPLDHEVNELAETRLSGLSGLSGQTSLSDLTTHRQADIWV
ncbi:MAG TPA: FAD-linked oxidase C-terminal domain-containing protein [Thermoflexales bacterium]|nr:FAD-linked oxidase C-terminal domain-containing protein [Thermoflexales bacterium]